MLAPAGMWKLLETVNNPSGKLSVFSLSSLLHYLLWNRFMLVRSWTLWTPAVEQQPRGVVPDPPHVVKCEHAFDKVYRLQRRWCSNFRLMITSSICSDPCFNWKKGVFTRLGIDTIFYFLFLLRNRWCISLVPWFFSVKSATRWQRDNIYIYIYGTI